MSGALLSGSASAEPDLGEIISRLPMSIDMVLAVDDGARLRRELGEMPLMLTLASLPRPAMVIDAWSGLAEDLGMDDAEAFDLLLGRRMVIVGADLQPDKKDGPQWALLSELDPATERLLRAELGAVPRRIVRGQPVLEFEHGSFLLATSSGKLHCTGKVAFDSTPASTLLLLAPASDRTLFESLLPLLHCKTPTNTLGQLPCGETVAAFAARDAVLLQRLPDPATSMQRFFAANIGLNDGIWRIEATAGPATAWVPEMTPDAIDTWSPELLETLPQDPALVLVGTRKAVREAREWAQPLIATSLPDPERDGLGPLLGDRSVFAVWLSPETPIAAEPEVLFATEAPDLARLIQQADDYLVKYAAGNPPQTGTRKNIRLQKSPDAERLTPTTIRSLPIEPGATISPTNSAIAPMLNWLYVPKSESDDPASQKQSGWWIVHCDPTGNTTPVPPRQTETTDPLASLIAGLPPRRYLHVGRALPQRWANRVAAFSAPSPRTPQDYNDSDSDGPAGSSEHLLLSSAIVMPQIRLCEWAVWYESQTGSIDAQITIDLRAGIAETN